MGALLAISGKMDKIIDKDSETTKPLETRLREEPGHISKACLNVCRQKYIAGLLLVESATSLQRAVLIILAKSGSKNKIVTTIKPGNIPLDQQHHGTY